MNSDRNIKVRYSFGSIRWTGSRKGRLYEESDNVADCTENRKIETVYGPDNILIFNELIG